MLRVIVEIVPFGVEEDKRVLDIVEIANISGGNISNYRIQSGDKTEYVTHDRSLGFEKLVLEALRAMY